MSALTRRFVSVASIPRMAFLAVLLLASTASGQTDSPFVKASRSGSEAFAGTEAVQGGTLDTYVGQVVDKSTPVPIYFPAHPPPLGVATNTPPDHDIRGPLHEQLAGEIMEPYFPQLSSRLGYSYEYLNRGNVRRLAEYRQRRAQLLREVRRKIDELEEADATARFAGFSALAQAQASSLRELEAEAESLRRRLASGVNWYEVRRWQLGEDSLDLPRKALAAFEYQVVRATAFYRDGLSPAQRRLLREALQIMDQKSQPGKNPIDDFVFFSPDMMRVKLPSTLPEKLAGRVVAFARKKDDLRRELWDAAYEADFAKSGYSRRKAMRRYAQQNAERLDALEEEAEQIRIELAPTRDDWRWPRPVELPADLQALIDYYLAEKDAIRFEISEAVRQVEREWPPQKGRTIKAEEFSDLKAAHAERLEAARTQAIVNNTARFAEMNRILDQIEIKLEPFLISSDIDVRNQAADSVLMKFLQRRSREMAFYEYDIAAFELGLSPRQRQLLFAGAVTRFDLPLAGPELQPTFAPQTILPVE